MNAKNLTAAFAIALLVSGLCTFALSRKVSAKAAAAVPTVQYVTSSRPLQSGEVIKPDALATVSWPANEPVPGAFQKPQDLLGRAVLYPINKGQPITDKMLSTPGAGFGLAGKIPDGMRAVALRTDEVMGVAGFLMPGSHVDVLTTYHAAGSPDPITVTVLQNVVVLAAGHQLQPDPDGKPSDVTMVTLLLNPEDSEKAVLASTQGSIHFVLRSGSDQTIDPNTTPAMMAQLAPVAAEAKVASTAKPTMFRKRVAGAVHPRPVVVQTIAGEKASTQTFSAVQQ